jgi:DNA-binding NtrC family response regulator
VQALIVKRKFRLVRQRSNNNYKASMNTKCNVRVLLVDDEVSFLSGLSQHLEEGGLKVCTQTHTKEAIETLQRQDVDAIILDLAMPELDGLETLKLMKDVQPEAEIIILNDVGTVRSSGDAIESGVDYCFKRPLNLKTVPEKISKFLGKRVLVLQKGSRQKVGKILRRVWL